MFAAATSYTLRQRLDLIRPVILAQKPRLALIIVLSIVAAAFTAALPWPLKFLVDTVLGGDQSTGLSGWLLGEYSTSTLVIVAAFALLAVSVLLALNTALLDWTWDAAGQRMVYGLSSQTLDTLQRKSLAFHLRQTRGDLLNRISVDCWCAYTFASLLLVQPFKGFLTIVAVSVAAWMLSPSLTAVLLIVSPILAFSVWRFGPSIKQKAERKRAAESAISRDVESALSAIPIVQTYSLAARNDERLVQQGKRALRAAVTLLWEQTRFNLINGIAFAAAIALVTWLAATSSSRGELSIGSMLVFLAYVETLKNNFIILLQAYSATRAVEASMDRLLDLGVGSKVEEGAQGKPLVLASGSTGPEIVFENVGFSYDDGTEALHDVSLRIAPGETLALVGESGGGKSTFSALIPRFFDPSVGRILMDGQDLRDVSHDSLRSHIAIVLQDPFLLPLSIAENIAFGRPDASMEDIRAAAWAANAVDFIESLEDGYDTVLAEQGMTLSGGQRQRLAIARALIKDAPILVLDEPTSALDAGTEGRVVSAIARLSQRRTTIIIAHRLTTIRNADRVAVFEAGRIVQIGKPDELLREPGPFRRHCQLQGIEAAEGRG